MKQIKLLRVLAGGLLWLLAFGALTAQPQKIGELYYSLDNEYKTAGVTIGKDDDDNRILYSGDIVVPESVDYEGAIYAVTSIGEYAFYGCTGLTSIDIPSSVTLIGAYAFSGCTGLTSVSIPDSVTFIDAYAFQKCGGLLSLTFGESVSQIDRGIVDDCDKL